MRKRCFYIIFVAISMLLIGCNKNTKDQTKPTKEAEISQIPIDSIAKTIKKEDYPIVDGSTATIPLSEAVYCLVTGATKAEAASAIVHTKTTESYYRLMEGDADLLIVYEPSEEVKEYIKNQGIKLKMKPIGKDALVFMANTTNPVDSLTEDQLIDIYSGKITNWSEVGGEDKELLAFQRPVNSGSQTLMQKLVMKDVPMIDGPSVTRFDAMEGILKAMVDYTNEGNTLGYSVYYYAKNMYQLPELKFMKVNKIEPSLQTIYDNSYPYINEFYAVIREEEPKESSAHKIFDWLTKEEGQNLIRSLGYVPIQLSVVENSSEENVITEHLPNHHRYILRTDTTSYNGLNLCSVTIYDEDWQVQQTFQNVYYTDEVGLLPEDELLVIRTAVYDKQGSYTLKSGIFDLKKNEFLIPPEYDSIMVFDKEKGYYEVRNGKEARLIDHEGNNLLKEDFGEDQYSFLEMKGNYYWIRIYNESGVERTVIYDKNFKKIRTLDAPDYMNQIYGDDGTILFSKETFQKLFNLEGQQEDTFWIEGYSDKRIITRYGDAYWVLDIAGKLIKKHPISSQIDSVSYKVLGETYHERIFYAVTNIMEDRFYDDKGNLITDIDGNTYDHFVEYNYYSNEPVFYRYDKDGINVYDYNTKKHMDINIEDAKEYSVHRIMGDFVLLHTVDYLNYKTLIFMKNELLYNLSGNYYSRTDVEGKLLFENFTNEGTYQYFVINSQGQELYKSEYPEYVSGSDDYYIQMIRGNYTVVMDYEGNIILKTIKQELKTD